ncbi:hypothetical protein RIF29_07149 [Crotalaria pallida]|uniref:Uncharacterized protein n=1 Tax=Crotalaria pallida TaxID=3830 RepID=A0AAN9J6M2_CROPI
MVIKSPNRNLGLLYWSFPNFLVPFSCLWDLYRCHYHMNETCIFLHSIQIILSYVEATFADFLPSTGLTMVMIYSI